MGYCKCHEIGWQGQGNTDHMVRDYSDENKMKR